MGDTAGDRTPVTRSRSRHDELDVGDTVGEYKIVGALGEGRMGIVYVGEHPRPGRRAAIKVLRREYSRRPDRVDRFFAEARATQTVRHPGIVEVYDFGYTSDHLAYLAMELLAGVTLATRLAKHGALPVATAILVVRRVAVALAAVHDQGIVHGDVEPNNVFILEHGELGAGPSTKLLAFGIAALVDVRPQVVRRAGVDGAMGTTIYRSPEQCQGAGDQDQRSDLYSLGCLCFEILAGRPPFLADSEFELMNAHLTKAPPDLREHASEVPPDLAAIVDRLLAKAPAHRFATAGELIASLDTSIARHDYAGRVALL